jgi:pimeloyl-ACP methyl ester carboxylesterase
MGYPSPRLFTRRRLKWAVGLPVALVVFWLVASFVAAYGLTRRQQPRFAEPPPAVAWASLESERLSTCDGQQIGAWFVAGSDVLPAIILLHGNGGCRGSLLRQAEMLANKHYPVLLLTARAHGDSTGDVNDFGYSARFDVMAAVDWLQQRRPGMPIVLFGNSLGAAAAAFAAAELQERVAACILDGPYQDLRTAVRNRTEVYLPPVADWIAFQGLDTVGPLVLPDLPRISPLEAVGKIPPTVPVLILAGGADREATPDEARALFERVRSHAELVLFDGATHARLFEADPGLYRRSVLGLLERLPKASAHLPLDLPR